MKLKINKEDCTRADLNIPKGYRLIEDYECLKESRTNKELKNLLINGYVWVNTIKGTRAAGFGYNGGVFRVDGDYDLNFSDRSRGVFVKIRGEQE